jgi:hypothetical protein
LAGESRAALTMTTIMWAYTHIDVNNVNIVDNQQLKGQHFPAKVYIIDNQ